MRQALLLPLLLTSAMVMGCSAVTDMQEGKREAERISQAIHDELGASAGVTLDLLSGPAAVNVSVSLSASDVAAFRVRELRSALGAIIKAQTGRDAGTVRIFLQ